MEERKIILLNTVSELFELAYSEFDVDDYKDFLEEVELLISNIKP